MARKVGANADVTRQMLLDVAEQQFSQLSYAGATNQTLAREVGVSTGAIYHYYGSKADLYAQVCERALERLSRRFLGDVREGTNLKHAVHLLIEAAATHNREYPFTAGLLANLSAEARQHPEVAETVRKTQQTIRDLMGAVVDEVRADILIAGTDREDVIDVLVAVTDGFARFAVNVDQEHESRMLHTFAILVGV